MSSYSTDFEKFADILEKKIRKQIEAEMFANRSETPKSDKKSTTSRTSHEIDLLGSLLTSINPVHFYSSAGSKKYPHKPAKPRPNHVFNSQQACAFQFFLKQGAQLLENFNKIELDTAFRAMALKLHPDQGGTAEKFRHLLEARQLLKGLL